MSSPGFSNVLSLSEMSLDKRTSTPQPDTGSIPCASLQYTVTTTR